MRILDLAIKDLSQMFRDKRSLLFLIAMPIAFTFFMGFAYASGESNEHVDTRIPLALVDPEPESRLNKIFHTRLDSSDSIHIVSMNEAEAMDALHKGEVAGVLIVPVGFSDQAEAGRDASQLTLIADSASSDGQSLYQLLRVPISQLMSAVEVAHISADVQADSNEYVPSLELAWSKWNKNSEVNLVRVEQAIAEESESSDWTGGNPYNQASPGILVQFSIIGLITSAQIFVLEKKSRTLQRLITTAMKPWEIIAGHLLAMFTLTFLQVALLVVFGQLVLKVDYLREPLGILLVSVTLSLWAAAMGLLIGVIAKEEQQVIMYAMIAMFVFSGLGGTWFPLEASGGAFAAIGKTMPSYWAMNGYQNILIRGLGLASAWMPTLVILAYALGFFLLAVWRFRKMEM